MLYLFDFIASKVLMACIRIYQLTLSPDHGLASYYTIGACRLHPTCSEFAYLEVKKMGIRAIPVVFRRIKSCQPFSG